MNKYLKSEKIWSILSREVRKMTLKRMYDGAYCKGAMDVLLKVRQILDEVPSIDLIHESGGVYCCECSFSKFSEKGDYYICTNGNIHNIDSDDFCSFGEERGNAGLDLKQGEPS